MNHQSINENKPTNKRRGRNSNTGMYPGGGFVAWPNDNSTAPDPLEKSLSGPAGGGQGRKGYVAWPEKKPENER